MTQTQHRTQAQTPATSPTGSAKPAQAGQPEQKPADAKPSDAKPAQAGQPEQKPADAKPSDAAGGAPAGDGDKKKRSVKPRKVFIVVGTVTEFDSTMQAEKYLNSPDAPKEYTVIRGHDSRPGTRVTLR